MAIAGYLVAFGFLIREPRLLRFIEKHKSFAWILLIAGAILTISVTIYDDYQGAEQYDTLATQNRTLQDSLGTATNELRFLRESLDTMTRVLDSMTSANDSIMKQLSDLRQRVEDRNLLSRFSLKPELIIPPISPNDLIKGKTKMDTIITFIGIDVYNLCFKIKNKGKTAAIDSIAFSFIWRGKYACGSKDPAMANLSMNETCLENIELILDKKLESFFEISVYYGWVDSTISREKYVCPKFYSATYQNDRWSFHIIPISSYKSIKTSIPASKHIRMGSATYDNFLKWLYDK